MQGKDQSLPAIRYMADRSCEAAACACTVLGKSFFNHESGRDGGRDIFCD